MNEALNILGLHSDYTDEDLSKAYRHMVKKYHPDKYKGNTDMFLKVKEAYDLLKFAKKSSMQVQHKSKVRYMFLDSVFYIVRRRS